MIQPGRHYTLTLIDVADIGAWLDAGESGRVLLPRKHVPSGAAAGDAIDVFVYRDSEDRLVATTRTPLVTAGQFARLKVVEVNQVGAFLDWGLEKDLLVPFAEQKVPMEMGRSYIVYVGADKQGRLYASSKIDKFLKEGAPHSFKPGQPVELIIARSTDLGYKAIIDHSHWGVLYRTEVFQRLHVGQQLQGFIKHIRPDGKIDLSLQAGGETLNRQAVKIVQYLKENEGHAPLHDRTDPAVISKTLGMSKAAFKKCIGRLYRERVIDIEPDGIRLLDADRLGQDRVEKTVANQVWKRAEVEKNAKQPETGKTPGKPRPSEKTGLKPRAKGSAKESAKESVKKRTKERDVAVTRVPVELYKILKFEGIAGSGAEAKAMIAEGKVSVNGGVETRKRKQIGAGDIIQCGPEKLRVVLQPEGESGQ